jgi:hypothetical protein
MGWFVQHPLRILALGVIYVALWGAIRASPSGRRTNSLLRRPAADLARAADPDRVVVVAGAASLRRESVLFDAANQPG